MRSATLLLLDLLVLLAKSLRRRGCKAIIAENLILRHQLAILARSRKKAPNLKARERMVLGYLSLFIAPRRLRSVAIAISPATLLKFHRALVKRKYHHLFSNSARREPGPKGPSQELIAAIIALKQRNPQFGCPRIAYIITVKFGIAINKDVVRRVLAKHFYPDPGHAQGPSWLTFIAQSKDRLWSIDLFRCESLTLKSHWVLVVMDQWSRRIVGFGVHCGDVDGITLCRMFSHAISGADPPYSLSSDNDPLFRFHRWQANLRILEITEIKTVPFTPISHPFVERLIGTIRREYLDQVLFWNSLDLQRKLDEFKSYYNQYRTHTALSGLSPAEYIENQPRACVDVRHYHWHSHCRGMFHTPIPA